MNLEARNTEFVEEFLKLQNEESILRLEMILRKEQKASIKPKFSPLNQAELNSHIDHSESYFCNNRFKRSVELLHSRR
jgi:hypothetical protein